MTRYLLIVVFLLLPGLIAQVDTGIIAGALSDSSGAVLPHAAVVIRSVDTGLEAKLSSNDLGQYVSPPLPPGPYEISAEKPGFRRTIARVTLTLNQRAVVDLSLEVGSSQQEVTVAAESPLLESETSTVGNLRTEQSVRDLPLNGRNFAQLIQMTTGVVPAQTQVQTQSLTPDRGVTANVVNGAGFRANQMLVDGLDNTETHNGQGIVLYPPIEAIQEFNVATSVAPPEFGRGGANINVRIKSGTREFHGALFEFLRNSSLDAKNFFDPHTGKTPPFRMNQFGGVIGGPVALPKLRDKTFFFFDYEGMRQRQALTFVSSVPLPAFLKGDFSASPTKIFDPATTRASGAGFTRDPFPSNVIPANRIDPVRANLLALFPVPTLPGLANNYLLNPSEPKDFNNFDIKIDHRFTDRDLTFYRYSRHRTEDNVPGGLPSPALGSTSAGDGIYPVHQFVASYTHLFGPALVNESRAGVGRLFIDGRNGNYGVNVADKVGIPGVNAGSDPLSSGLPQTTISGLTVIGDSGFKPTLIISENWQYSDNLSWYRGAHSFKFGGEILHRRYNLLQTTSAHGIYTINGIFTQNLASPAGTGLGAADTLLGLPASGNITALGGSRGFRRTEYAAFVEDSWRLTPALTFNWGLRYELFPSYPWTEVHNRQANFVPSLGTVVPVGTPMLPERSGTKTNGNNFGPRLGLAWKFNSRMVARAAYGIFYQGESIPETNLPSANPPFTGSFGFANNASDLAGARRFSQGFPVSGATSFPIAGAQLYAIDPNFRLPYTQQWNLGVQREVGGNIVATVNYIATKGTRLVLAPDVNQPAPGPGAVPPRRPYPVFASIFEVLGQGNSIYHSLQVSAEKRFRQGLSFLASYTYAHGIDDGDFIGARQDLNNLRAERGNSATDLRQHFAGSWTWSLPLAQHSSGILGAVAGGWQANGILSLYSGLPFTVSSSINTLNGSGGQRADRIASGALPASQRTLQRWFDIGAFQVPGLYQFGSSGVDILNGPGTKQLDYSMFKSYYFDRDRHRSFQFRAELFNLFNTPQFNNPAASIGAAGVGSISSAGSKPTFQRTSRQVQFAMKFYF
jgi:hypothetical protein